MTSKPTLIVSTTTAFVFLALFAPVFITKLSVILEAKHSDRWVIYILAVIVMCMFAFVIGYLVGYVTASVVKYILRNNPDFKDIM